MFCEHLHNNAIFSRKSNVITAMTTTCDKNEDDPWTDLNCDDAQLQSLLDKPLEGISNSSLREDEQYVGFDSSVGDSWIYPSNLPCRTYQLSMVQAALYRNTLVVLPTGLGKTFIAAVIMYNIYRWYPNGKVIFMAPTRPLVNQQIEACQKIMPFPRKTTVELTGRTSKAKRTELWKSKRVFFATPQVVQSDIIGVKTPAEEEDLPFDNTTTVANTSEFPFDSIKLIVIDEAHKAKGKYAYTEVTQALAASTKYFRVLALSATPGRTMEDVAEVCRNLLISHIEVRWDTSIDVLPFVHKRHMETIVVTQDDRIKEIRENLLEIIDPYLRQLIDCNVLSGSLANINRNFLVFQQKSFQERSLHNGRHPQHSSIVSNFAICISMYHALELLERHGTRVFLNYFEEDEDGKAKFVIQMERRLRELVDSLNQEVGPNPFDISARPMTNGEIAQMPRDLDFGHPKFEKARECLLKHFELNADSRAIVFCEYRESVLLIYRMLLQHVPLLRPRCFVGQGGTGVLRALTQKQQIQIMNDFRLGKSNILIATSIGEEGIDVGEVDLIVCFDINTSNPTRFVQRIGRTGRQKNGNVVMLVTEGREQQILKEVLSNKDQINKKLLRSPVVQQAFYQNSPRLVPTEFRPRCIQTYVTLEEADKDEQKETKVGKPLTKKMAKSKGLVKVTQDLRKFFSKKPQLEMDAEDLKYFEIDTKMTQAKPGVLTQQKMEKSFDSIKNLFKELKAPVPTQKIASNKKENQNVSKENNVLSVTIDSCDDSPEPKTDQAIKECKKPLSSLGSIKSFFKDVKSTNSCQMSPSPKAIKHERFGKLKLMMEKPLTHASVVKRAKINDLAYHLQSNEMSNDMKYILLCQRPKFIKDNMEQINVLSALLDVDATQETSEEKSIREVSKTIDAVFEGRENVEKFLQDNELAKYKNECLSYDHSDEDSESEDLEKFEKNMDNIFKDLGEPLNSSDTYGWVKKKFVECERFKVSEKTAIETKIEESMVYKTLLVDSEDYDDASLTVCTDDNSMMDSKYCSQWQEFNRSDVAFKSTPLQHGPENRSLNLKANNLTKRSSLLTKLEEAEEEAEDKEEEQEQMVPSPQAELNQSLTNTSNKFLESLKTCEKSLNTLLQQRKMEQADAKQSTTCDMLKDDSFTSTDSNKTTGSLLTLNTEMEMENNYDKSLELSQIAENDEEEDELIQATLEAEIKFSQTKAAESAEAKPNHKEETFRRENLNSSVHYKPPSLNSTPDIDDFPNKYNKEATTSSSLSHSAQISMQEDLNIDMEAFMEPFPEEQELLKMSNKKSLDGRRESLKENFAKDLQIRESPDLFAEDPTKSPSLMHANPLHHKTTLSSKLAQKLTVQRCQSSINSTTSFKSPRDLLRPTKSAIQQTSPTSRLSTNQLKTDKSPSLFDMYLKNAKGKVRLPKALAMSSSTLGVSRMTEQSPPTKDLPPQIPCSQNDSPLVVRRKHSAAFKRKIFDSDTEETDKSGNDLTVLVANSESDDNSDFEAVPATQAPDDSSIYHRRKRRCFNSFIEHEAAQSGADESEDEAEHSIGGYLLDSVVVQSDDNDEDQASTTHMQGMYLQSLKSPQARRGAFKIPAHRVFNDHSRIFSQALLPEEMCSQYVPDSFIVDEGDSFILNNQNRTEHSLCPLERAEQILRERRKAKKKRERNAAINVVAPTPSSRDAQSKRKRAVLIEDSSDDDFD